MNKHRPRFRSLAWAALPLIGVVTTGALAAAGPPVDSAVTVQVLPASPAFSSLFAAKWWEKAYTTLESALKGNQKMMVWFCTIGAAIALWIIWWRK